MNAKKPRSTKYGEYKSRVNLALTDTALNGLDELAKKLSLSRSEFVERIGRGEIAIITERQTLGEFSAG